MTDATSLLWWYTMAIALSLGCLSIVATTSPGEESSAEFLESSADADAAILHKSVKFVVKGDRATTTAKVRIRVNNPDGKKLGYVILPENRSVHLKSFSGQVFDASGNVIYSVEKDDVARICGFAQYELYTDDCYRGFDLTSDRYPFELEYSYELKRDDLAFLPTWHPQSEYPVFYSSFELVTPSKTEMKLDFRGEIPEPTVTTSESRTARKWEVTRLSGFDFDPYNTGCTPSFSMLAFAPSSFEFGGVKFDASSWSSLSKGYCDLIDGCDKLSDDQKKLCYRIAQLHSDSRDRVEALHDTLMNRLRYVAIEIGVGGIKPTTALQTIERGYGDCKDMSVAYVAMLREMGIAANLALLSTQPSCPPSENFPALSRFDHVILMAVCDSDTVWIDPTCQTCRPGDLRWDVENTTVLCVDEFDPRLITTSRSIPQENLTVRTAELAIVDGRTLSAELAVRVLGNNYHYCRQYVESSNSRELDDLLTYECIGLSERFHVDSVKLVEQPDTALSMELRVWGSYRNAVHTGGRETYVDLSIFDCLRDREKTDLKNRSQPLSLKYPIQFTDTLYLSLPNGMSLNSTRTDIAIDDDFFRLQVNCRMDGNRLIVCRNRTSKRYKVDVQEFEEYTRSVKSVRSGSAEYLEFNSP